MKKISKMQELGLTLLQVCDNIIQKKLKNSIALGFWNRIGKGFIASQIISMPDKDIEEDLNMMYQKLKPHFDKKILKGYIEEANRLSDIKLSDLNNKEFKEASEYF